MINKGILFGIIGLVVLVGGVIVGILLVNQNQDFREKAAPASTIFISPSTQNKTTGDNFSLSVKIDTSSNLVTGVDVRIGFDTNSVEISSLQKGSGVSNFDSTITNDFNNSTGNISYAIFTLDKTKAVTGSSVEVLVINGKIKNTSPATTTKFNFGPTTSASGVDEGQNILIGMSSGSIVIVSGSVNQESGETPTASPTIIPISGGSNPTPTGIPAPTNKPTATSGGTLVTPKSTATAFPVPVTGSEIYTLFGISFGVVVLLGSFFLIF